MNKIHEQIQQAQDNILKSTINLVTEKELWKKRAERLAYRYSACLDCAESQVKLIDLKCIPCWEKTQTKEVHD